MTSIVSVRELSKTFDSGFVALRSVSLDIQPGEVFALLGPNGAGKTTLISIVCGITNATAGTVTIGGFDHKREYRKARAMIGLVPQELATSAFEKVFDEVSLSRGLFGLKSNPARVEEVLRSLTLWDKKDEKIMALSGGMKRRLLIAKALAHDPKILFLDEPTAGVDVELRQDMWRLIAKLKQQGVTIILTTHYLAEAEAIADRVGIIQNGSLLMVEDKKKLMKTLGKKRLTVELNAPLESIPPALQAYGLSLGNPLTLHYDYDNSRQADIPKLLADLQREGILISDLSTEQSSLEQIFMNLIQEKQP